MVVSGLAGATLPSPGSYGAIGTPHGAGLLAAGSNSPESLPWAKTPLKITSFYFSPDAFVESSGSTTVYATAVGPTKNLAYAYTGLPAGCASQNSTSFSCDPLANGTFVVQLNVTDALGNSTYANATLYVYPWAVVTSLAVTPSFADPAQAVQPCSIVNAAPFYTGYCYQQEQSPNVVSFPNGTEAVIASVTTRLTTDTCSVAAQDTSSRVQVFLTEDGGLTFAAPIDIGGSSCTYLNAIEPSFAVSGYGMGYGVFVEENSSAMPGQYASRPADGLGFTRSTDNGAKWSAASLIAPVGMPTGNLAHPVLATFGSTIYVAYEDIDNSSHVLPGGGTPISIQLVYSTNGGSAWNGPYTLPGLNASQFYNAMSPSIAVKADGTVAVAYATNRSCVDAAFVGCYTWGDSVVVSTSATNGTSWSAPWVVATGVGETTCPLGSCVSGLFQGTPGTSVAFTGTGGLLVGYSGTYSQAGVVGSANYRYTGVSLALSVNGGLSWSTQALGQVAPGVPTNSSNVAVAAEGTELYVTFTSQNRTAGTQALAESYTQWFASAFEATPLAFPTPILLGLDSMPLGQNTNATVHSYPGYSSALGFNQTGGPLVAFSLPKPPTYTTASSSKYFYANYTYPTNLSFAFGAEPGSPAVVDVTFMEAGLPANTSWGILLQGGNISTTMSEFEVLNIPVNVPVNFTLLSGPSQTWGILQENPPTASVSSPAVFAYDSTVTLTYYELFALNFSLVPFWPVTPTSGTYTDGYVDMNMESYSGCSDTYVDTSRQVFSYGSVTYYYNDSFYYDDNYCLGIYNSGGSDWTGGSYSSYYNYSSDPAIPPPSPFYLAAGFTSQMEIYDDGDPSASPVNAITGTGPGSFTGTPDIIYDNPPYDYYYNTPQEITLNAPINETVYLGGSGGSRTTFNESVHAYGLPAGTPYHFTWNGTTYSAVTPNAVPILNLPVGGYPVTDTWANGSTPGWEYFGNVNPAGPVVVPFQPNVNLTFSSYEEVGAPLQTVSFRALGLDQGTPWTLKFNGSSYSSSTPYINLSVRAGTYVTSAAPATSADGKSSYLPNNYGPSVTLTRGEQMVNVSYGPAYRVNVYAATGGLVSLGTGSGTQLSSLTLWAMPGASEQFTAAPSAGWIFLGWTGLGTGSYSGNDTTASVTVNSAIEETASFEPLPGARFSLNFTEAGLPSGTWWGVTLDGQGYSSSQPLLTVNGLYAWVTGAVGHYTLSVPYAYLNGTAATRFMSSDYPPMVGTNGTDVVSLVFTPQSLVSVYSSAGGTTQLVVGDVPSGGTWWASAGQQANLQETANSQFTFTDWVGTGAGSYSGTEIAPTITVGNGPITEFAQFMLNPIPPPRGYGLTVTLSTALASGTTWGIAVKSPTAGFLLFSSTGSSIVLSGLLPGSYGLVLESAMSPDRLTMYTALASNVASVSVTENTSVSVGYQVSYWVTIGASALGSAGPASGWYDRGATVSLSALPTGPNLFAGWVGTGSGNYTGPNATAPITVYGPLTEFAGFSPPAQHLVTTESSIWENPAVIAGLAVTGIVVGLLVGLAAVRRRGPGESAGPTSPEPAAFESEPGPAPPEPPAYQETPPEEGQP
jgi:hypothetical protein